MVKMDRRYDGPFVDNWSKVIVSTALFVLVVIGLSCCNYSGQGMPPKFGDYEAQRHWMEVTINLPLKEWYISSPSNNLTYWGLDYPPLTAYHSYAMGFIGNLINAKWFALLSSHGTEDPNLKVFMRLTVFLAMLFYLKGAYNFLGQTKLVDMKTFLICVMSPGLLLIDCGHFQYNSIALGLMLYSVTFLQSRTFILAITCFVFALNFKQISLYFALPMFVYLLRKCMKCTDAGKVKWQKSFIILVEVASITIAAFLFVWMPFIAHFDLELLTNISKRIFPVERGLFEDKVSTFWCVLSIGIKVKNIFSGAAMIRICIISVLGASCPSLYMLWKKPSNFNFYRSLFTTSMAFFLFSFHVHEKTILFPALAMLLMAPNDKTLAASFNVISALTLYPLLVVDQIPESLFFILAYAYATLSSGETVLKVPRVFYHKLSITVGFAICLCHLFAPIPPAYPYFWQLIMAIYGFLNFFAFYVVMHFVDEDNVIESDRNIRKLKQF